MTPRVLRMPRWPLAGWLSIGACLSVVALVWAGYDAITEWRQSATLLADRRVDTAVDLLVTALTRDMRAVQNVVLSSADLDEPADLSERVASSFARYPYPEVFFDWRGWPSADSVVFYARSDRYPAWLPEEAAVTRFPMVRTGEPGVAQRLLDRVARDTVAGRRFSLFDVTVSTVHYQTIALVSYQDVFHERPKAVFGFMVNLDWVRRHYFQEVTRQVARIGGADTGLTLRIFDDHGDAVVGGARDVRGAAAGRRTFPMMFFDPILVMLDPPPDLGRSAWIAQAVLADDPTLRAANRGAWRTLAIAVFTAIVLAAGFALTVQAARANAGLAQMRSEFVATVTHELKTPIATIRAISETLASGRSVTAGTAREYAQMAVHEAKRLTRLIDNLLAYSRVTDVADVYSFEPIAPEIVIDESLHEFASQLKYAKFDVHADVPAGLPAVRVDRTAIALVFTNLFDNAIRYSSDVRDLRIAARRQGSAVAIEVGDRGVGIPEDEIPHVTRRFFRGRRAASGGSGLGLALAQRIVADHGGTLEIRSAVGLGTTVSVTLPIAERSSRES